MPEPDALAIDRIRLRMPGGSADDARRLAVQVAEALAAGVAGFGQDVVVPMVRIRLPSGGDRAAAGPGLARRIADAVVRQLDPPAG